MTEDLRPPFRAQFDNARDPYTARNALGITGSGASFITSVSSPLVVTGGNLTIDLSSPPQGRLTLQTATPVMTTTQSGKIIIYYTPYNGNLVPIYNGTSMVMTAFSELSVATADSIKSPAAIGASKVNDWFVWNDGGTIRLGHGPDWTSDTARSAGTALTMVNGIRLNNAAITNGPAASRGTYVGTTRSNATSTLDWIYGAVAANGTAGFFGVWNCYNRVDIGTIVGDNTNSWSYALATIRSANASNTMRVSMIRGLDEDAIAASYHSMVSGAGTNGYALIGLDSTSTFSGVNQGGGNSSILVPISGYYIGSPGLGLHFVQACEVCQAAVALTFYGDVGLTTVQSGLTVKLRA